MTIDTFIETAIQGGWEERPLEGLKYGVIWLDPKAWQAVGKVEGWSGTDECQHMGTCGGRCPGAKVYIDGYQDKMHAMVTALYDGKSIEDYIKTL